MVDKLRVSETMQPRPYIECLPCLAGDVTFLVSTEKVESRLKVREPRTGMEGGVSWIKAASGLREGCLLKTGKQAEAFLSQADTAVKERPVGKTSVAYLGLALEQRPLRSPPCWRPGSGSGQSLQGPWAPGAAAGSWQQHSRGGRHPRGSTGK